MTKFFTDSDLQGLDQGPLGSIIPAYTAFLSKQGYTKHSTQLQLRFLTDMSQWLRQQQFQVADLTMSTIHRYMRSRYKRLRPRRDDNSILNRLLHMLHTEGLLMEETPQSPGNPHQRVQQDFDRYLSAERGLSVSTRNNYLPFIHQFLSAQFGDKSARFAALNAKDVIRFVQKQAPRLNPKRAGLMVSALRCFFRYLRHRGDIANDLAACVPSIANWRFSTLPKFLQPHQVQEVLRQCDCRTAHGRRDYAILLLLARLGLRACEIVSLNLDDIHWQAGEVRIQGKGNKPALLPLPPDVGQAIAAYLKKDRPVCHTRRVFIRMKAPRRGFANSIAISTIVARRLEKAGIDSPHRGAHLFRHSLATEMLRQNASLAEIALLLRHRSLNTTTLYAKVDLMSLQTLAQAWPGGA